MQLSLFYDHSGQEVDGQWLQSLRPGDAVAMVNDVAGVRYPAVVASIDDAIVHILGHSFCRHTGASTIVFLSDEWRLSPATAADLTEIASDRLSEDYDGRHDPL